MQNDRLDSGLHAVDIGNPDTFPAVQPDTVDHRMDNNGIISPLAWRVDPTCITMAFMDEQEADSQSFSDLQEHEHASLYHPPDLSKKKERKRREKTQSRMISIEDFDTEEEKIAFTLINDAIHEFIHSSTRPSRRKEILDWLYGNLPDAMGAHFELCCRVLGCRPYIVLLRLNYEMWKRWIKFSADLADAFLPIPPMLEHECRAIGGDTALDLLETTWIYPTHHRQHILRVACGAREDEEIHPYYQTVFDRLKARYIISEREDGSCYLTGRNPFLMLQDLTDRQNGTRVIRASSIHFSQLL